MSRARRRDRTVGLMILALAFASGVALSLWSIAVTEPRPARDPLPPTKVGLAGFPEAVRPFEVLPRARELTERSMLQGFVADGVMPDGTMNFTEKGTRLRFSFQSSRGLGAQPTRPGGTLPERTFCGRQGVRVTASGISAEQDVVDVACPRKGPKDLPHHASCGLEELWDLAKSRKIPDDGPAKIEYYWSDAGPAYRFSKEVKNASTQRFVVSAKDCKKILTGKKQRGSVP